MADTAPPKEGEIQVDVAKLGSDDIADVGDALAGLFSEENAPSQEIQQDGKSQPADTEEGESLPIGDTEEGQSEQSAGTAIEPPVSWTAEAKEQFKLFPPEAQKVIAQRESEREALLATQSQKATDEARRLDTERQQIANDRAQQVLLLQGVLLQLNPELQRFQNVDWAKLAAEKPAEWAQQRQAYDDLQSRLNLAQHQIAHVQGQQAAEQEKQHKTYLAAEQQKLVARVPEFADPVKAKAFVAEVTKYIPEITPTELNGIADHRQILILREAMMYRKAVAARAEAQTKRAPPAAASNVRQLRPAPARAGTAREEAEGKQLAALHDNLRRSGTTQATADLLAATGIFGKS
jgi:hypothetical protein